MNKHLKELVSLSMIDKELDRFAPQIEAADKKVLREKKKVEEAEARLGTFMKQIEENRNKISSYEEQITILSNQLQDIQKKSKEISTEKEMKALSIEEEIAREKLTFANEEIERLGKVNETKEAQMEEVREELEKLAGTLRTAEEEAGNELEAIEKEKESLYRQREEVIRMMDQKVLSFYEKIRKWAGNTAVVPVRKQACYGCFLKISDKTYSDVIRGEEIISCPHCGRILYLEEADSSDGA